METGRQLTFDDLLEEEEALNYEADGHDIWDEIDRTLGPCIRGLWFCPREVGAEDEVLVERSEGWEESGGCPDDGWCAMYKPDLLRDPDSWRWAWPSLC